jgi:hypothetical protein
MQPSSDELKGWISDGKGVNIIGRGIHAEVEVVMDYLTPYMELTISRQLFSWSCPHLVFVADTGLGLQ